MISQITLIATLTLIHKLDTVQMIYGIFPYSLIMVSLPKMSWNGIQSIPP